MVVGGLRLELFELVVQDYCSFFLIKVAEVILQSAVIKLINVEHLTLRGEVGHGYLCSRDLLGMVGCSQNLIVCGFGQGVNYSGGPLLYKDVDGLVVIVDVDLKQLREGDGRVPIESGH